MDLLVGSEKRVSPLNANEDVRDIQAELNIRIHPPIKQDQTTSK